MAFDFSALQKYLKKLKSNKVKKSSTNAKNKKIEQEQHHFLPFVSHYNENTIITKNGELIQVIRVVGYNNSTILHELSNLRDSIRYALRTYVNSNNIAIWVNTIRRRKNISPEGEFDNYFTKKINDFWEEKNSWNKDFINELYISVVIEGFNTSIINFKTFFSSFSYFTTKFTHQKYLENSHQKLSDICDKIINFLQDHGAKKLGINEWNDVVYSEIMRFLGKICNLQEDYYPLVANEICQEISQNKVIFGGRQIEVNTSKGKSFSAILSLKEYFDINLRSLDKILQLPCEFIISQSLDFFADSKNIVQAKKDQYSVLKLSESLDFARVIDLDKYLDFEEENKKSSPSEDQDEDEDQEPSDQTDSTEKKIVFGKIQTTIMIINNTLKNLEEDIKLMAEQFRLLGLPIIREDIFLEHCFWAQLPANFTFLKRQKITPLNYFATFSALHSFSSGKLNGNLWGPAIATFRTIMKNPYFFNFHCGKFGNTLVFGNKNSGKRVIANFLLTQAKRINHRLFYFDFNNNNLPFILSLSGESFYIPLPSSRNVSSLEKVLAMNPLFLQDDNTNHRFLSDFLFEVLSLISKHITEQHRIIINQKLDIAIDNKITDFLQLKDLFQDNQDIWQAFNNLEITNFYDIFNHRTEINWQNHNLNFNLSEILSDNAMLYFTLQYLLHKIIEITSEDKVIVVFRDPLQILVNQNIEKIFFKFCNNLQKKGGIVVFVIDDTLNNVQNNLLAKINEISHTKIIGAVNSDALDIASALNLSEEEAKIIPYIGDQPEKTFLLKNDNDSVFINFELKNYLSILKILSSSPQEISIIEEIIQQTDLANLPEWLNNFFEIVNILEQENQESIRQAKKAENIAKAKISKASRYID
jgi:type IV secretion system protein VirB4